MKKYSKISGCTLILIFVICSCNQEQQNFNQAKDSESAEELERFITSYPQSEYVDSAKILLEKLHWQEASQNHQVNAYEAYLQKYPEGYYVDSANFLIEKLHWHEASKNHQISAYEAYLLKYPSGKYADSAKFYMETPVTIQGILTDKEGKPLKGKSMKIYIANAETTVDTEKGESQKSGIVRQIKGTGTLAMSVKGVEGGGALKLMNGKVVNPDAKTDETGDFKFNLSADFLAGENELLVTVDYQDTDFFTVSFPLVDREGNPLILRIEKATKAIYLDTVRTLKE